MFDNHIGAVSLCIVMCTLSICHYYQFTGKGGRVRSGGSLSAFIVKNLATDHIKNFQEEDARAAILKHAEVYLAS